MLPTHLPSSNYRLIDFGNGRKLEKIGNLIVDRPCPGASGPCQGSSEWQRTDLAFDSVQKNAWHYFPSFNDRFDEEGWMCEAGLLRLKLKPTPAGQIGIFPEHWAHWDWIHQQCIERRSGNPSLEFRVLNLFAYTGATTLYLARIGCHVTHVDASKPSVDWAKDNSSLSNMPPQSIRWIVDDAVGFVKREVRRNRQYDAILLDPPSYGHGTQGKRWEIHRDLVPLLMDCWKLLSNRRFAVVLCGHSSHIGIREINQQLHKVGGREQIGECSVVQTFLTDDGQRRLDCGFAARYSFPIHASHA